MCILHVLTNQITLNKMKFIIHTFLTALALILTTYIITGISVDSLLTAVVVAFFLGIINAFVRPILVFLTFPITVVTFGLFIFVINAGIFYFAGWLIDGFYVSGFWDAIFGSILVSIVSWAAYKITD